jgi:hypothetical protein
VLNDACPSVSRMVAGSLPSARNWSASHGRRLTRIVHPPCFPRSVTLTASAVDLSHELPAPHRHELVDAGAGAIQRLDDRATRAASSGSFEIRVGNRALMRLPE